MTYSMIWGPGGFSLFHHPCSGHDLLPFLASISHEAMLSTHAKIWEEAAARHLSLNSSPLHPSVMVQTALQALVVESWLQSGCEITWWGTTHSSDAEPVTVQFLLIWEIWTQSCPVPALELSRTKDPSHLLRLNIMSTMFWKIISQ